MRKQRTRLRLVFYLTLLVFGQPHRNGWEVGAVFLLAGSVLHAWAAGTLTKNRALTVSGPYRFVRNPFYVGDFLRDVGLLFACHAATGVWSIPVWVLSAAYFVLMYRVVIRNRVIQKEEPKLGRIFGDAYEGYCQQVPRFVPRWWPVEATAEGGFSLATLRRNREQARLLAMVLLIGITYYRWEAFYHDFDLGRMLNDSWELCLFATLPVLLAASKVRVSGTSQSLAERLTPWAPWALLLWAVSLLGIDYRPTQSGELAWGLGLMLFAAGWLLRLASRTERRRSQGLAIGGVHGVIRQPQHVGTVLILAGLACCAKLVWLLPVSVCVTASILTPVIRLREAHLDQCYGAAHAEYVQRVPRWWPGWNRLGTLCFHALGTLRHASLAALRPESVAFLVLLPFAVGEFFF